MSSTATESGCFQEFSLEQRENISYLKNWNCVSRIKRNEHLKSVTDGNYLKTLWNKIPNILKTEKDTKELQQSSLKILGFCFAVL